MLSVAELGDRIRTVFPDAAQVSDTAVRFVRSAGNKPYAICYVDVTQKLPESADALTRYQDHTIGQHYFEGRRSLQWSNYLYFLQSSAALKRQETLYAKQLIEADRSYARKFVLDENELDDILAPPTIEAPEVADQINIMAIWARKLTQPGLYDAVFKDAVMPKRLSLIENAEGEAPPTSPATSLTGPRRLPPLIKELEIKKYRVFPKRHHYGFGKVNLIVGPNAVGKTSLLEAIELFYCGRNNRNPEARPKYSFRATFVDGTEQSASDTRPQKEFRDRNLAWYGQSEIKTNTLYQSFALFNFLDTDAAVRIADSAEGLEDNLSRLLVGPNASNVWRNIERVSEALETQVRLVSTRYRENRVERDRLAAQLKAEENLPQESDAIRGRLGALMRKLKWSYPVSDDEEDRAANIASALSDYASFAEQAGELAWVPSPASIEALRSYCAETSTTIERAASCITDWIVRNRSRTQRETELRILNTAVEHARDAKLLIEAGVPRRTIDELHYKERAAQLATQLAGTDGLKIDLFSPYLLLNLKASQQQAAADRANADAKLRSTRKQLADFTALREKAQNLAQQLRAIAEQILPDAADPDVCPLCHTRFEAGELEGHMHEGVDTTVEAAGQELLQLVRNDEAELEAARTVEEQINLLADFVSRVSETTNIEVAAALKLLDEHTRELSSVTTALNRVEAELRDLDARNLSQARFQRAVDQLARLGRPLENHSLQGVVAFETTLTTSITNVQTLLETHIADVEQLRGQLQQTLGVTLVSIEDAHAAAARLKERLITTRTLLDRLAEFTGAFPWPPRSPLADLLISARQVRSLAAELQTALQREAQRRKTHSEALAHKEELDRRLAQLDPVRERLIAARSTLNEIKNESALTSALQSALQANRDAIEGIFARIHAPPEFTQLGDNFKTLRRANGEEAEFAEISTGQRAAFALSIFLARNAQLITAPPVILIDDPIAHIDDFNALSFLDYLRTLVIAGGRQIFFATANDKIAALFERKFDFLGDDFCRINLSREVA